LLPPNRSRIISACLAANITLVLTSFSPCHLAAEIGRYVDHRREMAEIVRGEHTFTMIASHLAPYADCTVDGHLPNAYATKRKPIPPQVNRFQASRMGSPDVANACRPGLSKVSLDSLRRNRSLGLAPFTPMLLLRRCAPICVWALSYTSYRYLDAGEILIVNPCCDCRFC
jgi:hypothetical protein